MFGVGEVTVYNNSLSDDVSAVFLHYQKVGYVDFRQAPNIIDHPSEFMILMNMSPAINDCLYRNMYRYNVSSALTSMKLLSQEASQITKMYWRQLTKNSI